MTDEEMAEKWVTANTGFNPKEPLGKIAVRTFLAGLKAGKDMAEADLATVAYMQGAESQKKKTDKQLSKVKVALRKVVDYLGQFCSDYPDCVIEAEQFLKESDNEKAGLFSFD